MSKLHPHYILSAKRKSSRGDTTKLAQDKDFRARPGRVRDPGMATILYCPVVEIMNAAESLQIP
ncbi:MAG: hypothetical protein M1598_00545, partial [Actinobacteria bacterium]|nr:hypothetical protein [Actinomycetota bacterium]